jgi:hypothetical protein
VGTQERLVTLVRPEEQDDANLRDAGGHEEWGSEWDKEGFLPISWCMLSAAQTKRKARKINCAHDSSVSKFCSKLAVVMYHIFRVYRHREMGMKQHYEYAY